MVIQRRLSIFRRSSLRSVPIAVTAQARTFKKLVTACMVRRIECGGKIDVQYKPYSEYLALDELGGNEGQEIPTRLT